MPSKTSPDLDQVADSQKVVPLLIMWESPDRTRGNHEFLPGEAEERNSRGKKNMPSSSPPILCEQNEMNQLFFPPSYLVFGRLLKF